MARELKTFLMFEGTAEEAINLYLSLFNNAALLRIERYGTDGPGKEGSVKLADFTLAGHALACSDSFVKHAFTFTPSSSLFVECENEAELDRAFGRLSEGGTVMMPPNDYGFSTKFAWVSDRFGVSWQLNLR